MPPDSALHRLLVKTPPSHTLLIPRTSSIKQFQKFHGLPATGSIDHATQRKMRQVHTTVARGALGYGGPH